MARKMVVGTAIAAVLFAAIASFRNGVGEAPSHAALIAVAAQAEPAARVVLYWKDPDGKNDFSPGPKKTADGRDYLPVYESDEKGIGQTTSVVKPKGPGKILYYRNPMGLADISKIPKKDSMGMDYIPVYEGEEGGADVKISLDRVQRSGVRTEVAKMEHLARVVRLPGISKPDERTLRIVSLRSDGFIEKLYVNETGAHITEGQPLFRVYNPLAVSAQVNYRTAGAAGRNPIDDAAATQRLKNLDVPQAVINQMREGGQPVLSFDWPAPASGYVMEKNVIEGQMAKAGEPLFKIAGLDPVWVIADVSEQEFGLVHIGAIARLHFLALPDKTFEGRVTFILHELDPRTRTAKVRIELPNPDHAISHEMYADVEIDAGSGDADRLTVPSSAVIDSGSRQIVIVSKGDGLFEPRAVKFGVRGDGLIEITDGLKAGESVVVAANFLIDSESNLKAALQSFTAEPTPKNEMGVKP